MYYITMDQKTVGELCKAVSSIIACAVVVIVGACLLRKYMVDTPTDPNAITITFSEEDVTTAKLILLYEAVAQKEGWRGRNGAAGEVGPVQITDICLEDYVEHHTPDRKNAWGSWLVFEWYLTHYGLDRGVPFDQLPRIWNGGPDGHRENNTVQYGEDVMRFYAEQQNNN